MKRLTLAEQIEWLHENTNGNGRDRLTVNLDGKKMSSVYTVDQISNDSGDENNHGCTINKGYSVALNDYEYVELDNRRLATRKWIKKEGWLLTIQ